MYSAKPYLPFVSLPFYIEKNNLYFAPSNIIITFIVFLLVTKLVWSENIKIKTP